MNSTFKALILLFFSLNSFGQFETITNYKDPSANGNLILNIRDDSTRYLCDKLIVKNGVVELCENNPEINYSYFIKRNEIDSSWLNNVLREYDVWMDIPEKPGNGAWLNYEKTASHAYKEDFTGANQKTGLTYKHHESRKHLISYTFANPNGKVYQDDSKFQFQYDWEENIKGRFESLYSDGLKKFRHNYEINRLMAMDKSFSGKMKTTIDAQINGTIQSYYPNGKKKAVVTYSDRFVAEKTEIDNHRKLLKASREGEKSMYRENGKLFCKGAFNINGITGKLEYFGPKGINIVKIETYKDGILNGKTTEFYLDGTVKLKGEYKDGEKVGDWIAFDEEGKKVTTKVD